MKKIFFSLMMAVCLFCSCLFGSCQFLTKTATVQSISITTMPKIEYVVGEQLDLTGGELTATYSDNTTKKVSLTDTAVTVQKPNMKTAGQKTVSVTYESKSTTFKVTVSEPKLAVIFDLNYEGSQPITEYLENGAKVSAPETNPTRDGYAFLGWYIAADSATKFNFDVAIAVDTTIYARWGYAVEFNMNYDGAQNTTQIVNVGEKVSAPATNPTREGYLFAGWFTTATCETAFNFDAEIKAKTVVYAGWTEVAEDVTVYEVTFVYNDGTGATQVKQIVEGEKVEKPADPTLEGATFQGWFTDEALANAYDFDTPVTASMSLYASWKVSRYTVTFHYNHANNSSVYTTTKNIRPDAKIQAPEIPVLDGYYFMGWYKDTACTEKVDFTTNRINEFAHFYAKWNKEWEFQAEYTDFADREAFGYSANGTGASAFIMKNGAEMWGAHNGYWVANMHKQGLFVEFVINSDQEVFDAALVLRLSADFYDITLHRDNFEIKVNGTVIAYEGSINLTGAVAPDQGGIQNKRPFTNHEVMTNLHLVKGQNVIRFTMTEEKRYGEVGTMYATAPMMDSIYVNTNATLSWTPKTENV